VNRSYRFAAEKSVASECAPALTVTRGQLEFESADIGRSGTTGLSASDVCLGLDRGTDLSRDLSPGDWSITPECAARLVVHGPDVMPTDGRVD
jgi:hypothetical protein